MMFYRIFNFFVVIINIVASIHIFYEPKKHNPYKYARVAICVATAGCFALMTAPVTSPLIRPMLAVGVVLIAVGLFISHKDSPYSIDRVFDKVNARKSKRVHKESRK